MRQPGVKQGNCEAPQASSELTAGKRDAETGSKRRSAGLVPYRATVTLGDPAR